MKHLLTSAAAALALTVAPLSPAFAQSVADGSKERPLRVLLIPADGGTESGTKADYLPVFNAISRTTGLQFDLKVGQSYGAVVEGMCNQLADIAFFGPVSYVQAHQRGCAQLLAVGVEKGASIYYAGMFAKADAPIAGVQDVKGKRVAFGDVNSASSFTFQISMLLDAGIDPVRDLAAIRMTGSHANSLAALVQGQVDVASLSFDSYEKAVKQGAVDPKTIKVIARSPAIPYPPLALNSKLPEALKTQLKSAFSTVNKAPGITPDMIRGYGGAKIDGYDTQFSEAEFNVAAQKLALLTDELKGRILKKAAER
ncbi:phosphate/phosphite/phosphonate ABC transporter substrate-binding protein [Variovorax arabinosiphilus]|uniref:phosphate/phosphite/phosphonate ABC transporter substrate-binding protein n=1 Tax=Variovorax arabinosiphilus TaxID=3053498 RepID=UPI0025757C51|nr:MULTISPECIES: phosphate/phosphite/phosphonate ABC transporter substrate-binding protein [unclassified Variovorax]MDM0122812.1 phosphate/phosphite/phosphonate ABC transporter substrate-binding protein [Variovorax sp. J2L1-78]MDM0132192.1 phosphate/phosphite/phosphonate ABC transporter substrate-binding protein [Variovorax sp. J2L1-63]MDM0235575.1 phosphate/phosphite/phosphonate ABC transporter substrate-binding protein [Variovorax sp. J2R1-6]